MNFGKFAVIGGDLRFCLLAQALKADKQEVYRFFLSQTEQHPLSHIANADYVILPLPISKDGVHLNAPLSQELVGLHNLFTKFHPRQILFGGIVDAKIQTLADAYALRLLDYYDEQSLILPGALATAEGAIALSITETQNMLQGQKALVLGFGRIAKILAQKLAALGVDVTIAARKALDLHWASTLNYHALALADLDEHIQRFDLIFNTVPHPILDFRKLVFLKPNALCIELASKPYGIDLKSAENLGVHTILAESLPGKVAPNSMALALKNTIYSLQNSIDQIEI